MIALHQVSRHIAAAALALALSLTMIGGTVSTPATPAFTMEYVA